MAADRSGPTYEITDVAIWAIREGMEEKRWNNQDVADEVGTTRQTISNILNKRVANSELLLDILIAVGNRGTWRWRLVMQIANFSRWVRN